MAGSLLSLIKVICYIAMLIVIGRTIWRATATRGGVTALIPGLLALCVLSAVPPIAAKFLAVRAPATTESTFTCTIFDSKETAYKFTNNEGGLNSQYKLEPSDASAIVQQCVAMGTSMANGLWEGMVANYIPMIITAVAIIWAVAAFLRSQDVVDLIMRFVTLCLLWSLVVGSVNQTFPRAMLKLANSTITSVSRALMVNLTTWAQGRKEQIDNPDMWSDMHLQMAIESANLPASVTSVMRAYIVQAETSRNAKAIRDQGYFSPQAFALLKDDVASNVVDTSVPMRDYNARIGGGGYATNNATGMPVPEPLLSYYSKIMCEENNCKDLPVYKGRDDYPWSKEMPTLLFLRNANTTYNVIDSDGVRAFCEKYMTTKEGDFIFSTGRDIASLQQDAANNKYVADAMKRVAYKVSIGIIPLGKYDEKLVSDYKAAFNKTFNDKKDEWESIKKKEVEAYIKADNNLNTSESAAGAYRSAENGKRSQARAILGPPDIVFLPTLPIKDHLEAMYLNRGTGCFGEVRTGPPCVDILKNKDALNPHAFGCLLGAVANGAPAGANLGGTARIAQYFKTYAKNNNAPGQGSGFLSPANGLIMSPTIFDSTQPGGMVINPAEKKSVLAQIVGWFASALEWIGSGSLWVMYRLTGYALMLSAMVAAPLFVGMSLMFVTAFWPIIAVASLWPGRWALILDWTKAIFWIMSWATVCYLGAWLWDHADVWGGIGARSLTLKYIQMNIAVLIMMASPIITKVILSPSVDGLSGVAGPLVKTVATGIGAVAGAMATAAVVITTAGMGAAAAGAGAAGAAGGATTSGSTGATGSVAAKTGASVASRGGGTSFLGSLGGRMRGLGSAGKQRVSEAMEAMGAPARTGGDQVAAGLRTLGKVPGQGGLSTFANNLMESAAKGIGKEIDSLTRNDDGVSHSDRMASAMANLAAGDTHGAQQALKDRGAPSEGPRGGSSQPHPQGKKDQDQPVNIPSPATARDTVQTGAAKEAIPASMNQVQALTGAVPGATTEQAGQVAEACEAMGSAAEGRANRATTPQEQAQWHSVAAQAMHTAAAARAKQAHGSSGDKARASLQQAESNQTAGDEAAARAVGSALTSGTGTASVAVAIQIAQNQSQAYGALAGRSAQNLVEQFSSPARGDQVIQGVGERLGTLLERDTIDGKPLKEVVQGARARVQQGVPWEQAITDLHHELRTHALKTIRPDDAESQDRGRKKIEAVDQAFAGSFAALGRRVVDDDPSHRVFSMVPSADKALAALQVMEDGSASKLPLHAPTLATKIDVSGIINAGRNDLRQGAQPGQVLLQVHHKLREAVTKAAESSPGHHPGEPRAAMKGIEEATASGLSVASGSSVPVGFVHSQLGAPAATESPVSSLPFLARRVMDRQPSVHTQSQPSLVFVGRTIPVQQALLVDDPAQREAALMGIAKNSDPRVASTARMLALHDPAIAQHREKTGRAITPDDIQKTTDEFNRHNQDPLVRLAVQSAAVGRRIQAGGELAVADAVVGLHEHGKVPASTLSFIQKCQVSPEHIMATAAALDEHDSKLSKDLGRASTTHERKVISSKLENSIALRKSVVGRFG